MSEGRPSPFLAGLLLRCPRCGRGKIFKQILTVNEECPYCQFPLGRHEVGDGPAYGALTVMCLIVIVGVLWLEMVFQAPVWLQLAIWFPLITLGTIQLLRWFKGWLIAYQYAFREEDFDYEEPSDDD